MYSIMESLRKRVHEFEESEYLHRVRAKPHYYQTLRQALEQNFS